MPATGDLDEFRAIHRHLFQDVYSWAGQLRTVDLRKNIEGAEFFLPVSMIHWASQYAAKQRFIVHLRPEELAGTVGRGVDLGLLLKQLVEWGNLKADPDTSRVATVEEFNRVRFVYQMTAAGESAERAHDAHRPVHGAGDRNDILAYPLYIAST